MPFAPHNPHHNETAHEVDHLDVGLVPEPASADAPAAHIAATPETSFDSNAPKTSTPEATEPIKNRSNIATYYALARVKFDYLLREAAKFGVVGIIALVIDVGLFNLLSYAGPFAIFAGKPLTAKVVAVAVAMTFAYFANRFWTFRHRGRTSMAREYVLFVILNLVGMGIALSCLWFSHYALGLTSPLADNISANVVGLILGTLFRFWAYRKWVFPEVEDELATELADEDAQAA